MAGQPPLSSSCAASTPRRAANPASSSSEKRRSSSVRRSNEPCAASPASGTAGAHLPASITCALAGRASISSASQRAPLGVRSQHVHVVEHQAHGGGTALPGGVGDRQASGSRSSAPANAAVGAGGERRQGVTRQGVALGVARPQPQPHVAALRRQPVLGQRLSQQGGLPQPGAADHGRDVVVPPAEQGAQQPGPGSGAGPRRGGSNRTSAASAVQAKSPGDLAVRHNALTSDFALR